MGGSDVVLEHLFSRGFAHLHETVAGDPDSEPLDYASMAGHVSTGTMLLDALANATKNSKISSNVGQPKMQPLHWAALHGHLELTKYLVQRGVDVLAIDPSDGSVPLDLAKVREHESVTRYLEVATQRLERRDL